MPGKMLAGFAALALAFTAAVSVQAEQAAPPTHHYVVKRALYPPVIDGVVNEAAWKACEPIELGAAREGEKVGQKTTARIMWDDRYLYLSFECEDSHIWSTMTERDQPIYNEEVVEAFINPDGDREGYLELEVNPLNTLWDGYIENTANGRVGHLAWNSFGLRRAVFLDGTLNDRSDTDGGWSVEMAVPLEDIVTGAHTPPVAGDRWRLNLYRIDLPEGAGVRGEYYAWSPISGKTFHDPDRFGEIQFSDEPLK
ncbi:carbohydrate-binding family 9-like protein [bacterium]|nr:carbohydrate-binding family 9-like protein [bacterium]